MKAIIKIFDEDTGVVEVENQMIEPNHCELEEVNEYTNEYILETYRFDFVFRRMRRIFDK